MRRSTWHINAHIPVFFYLISLVMTLPWIVRSEDPKWLLVHLLLLGAITNLIFIWSTHFSLTMLRLPNFPENRGYVCRVLILNIGIWLVIIGKSQEAPFLIFTGVASVSLSAALHALAIRRYIAKALLARFRKVMRYYISASLFLTAGAVIGANLSQHHSAEIKSRFLVAHYLVNVLGWVGLTVAGTLITFIPTMLRTKLPEFAEKRGQQSLPWLVTALTLSASGALLGKRFVVALGVVGYLAAWSYLLSPHFGYLHPIRKLPFSIKSVVASAIWLFVALLDLTWTLLSQDSWTMIKGRTEAISLILAIGFALQIVFGAFSYLVPMIIGGGPNAVRLNNEKISTLSNLRFFSLNVGLLILATNGNSPIFYFGGFLVLATLIIKVALIMRLVFQHLNSHVHKRN
jgi:nitrite reductase (NO-forming)